MTKNCSYCKQPINGVSINLADGVSYCYDCSKLAVRQHWNKWSKPLDQEVNDLHCQAITSEDDAGRCSRSAITQRQGHPVCNQHAQMYDRWQGSGRDARSMAWYHWRWHDPVA